MNGGLVRIQQDNHLAQKLAINIRMLVDVLLRVVDVHEKFNSIKLHHPCRSWYIFPLWF